MREEKIRRLLGMIVLSLMTVLNGGSADLLAAPSGVLKQGIHWGLSADWLDPATTGAYSSTAHLMLYLFHDALIKPMPEGNYTPCLAESYKVSQDFKVYEFKLRRGVKFHNGDTMTAEDVVFSYWRYKSAQSKIIHGKTEKVEIVDPYLVRIQFKEPFPDFLDRLLPGETTIGWVVPKKYIEKVGESGFKRHPVGAGPYKFVEFMPGVKLVGEAFEDYWRKVPYIKRMEFYIVIEQATRLAMLKRGEIDIATTLQGVFYEDAKKDPNLRMVGAISPARFLVFPTAQFDPKSPWADVRVRKAASLAVDRQSLVAIHHPESKPIGSLGLEGDPFALHLPADPYDPEQAKRLLAEAGYPKGFHGGTFYPYEGGYWAEGEQVANYWKAVGISVDTILLDRPAWWANRQAGKMKGATFIDSSTAPTIAGRLSYLFTIGSYGSYPDLQALWERYERELATEIRKELIGRMQNLVREKAMFLPLTSAKSNCAFGPKVKGNPFKVQPLMWITCPFEDVELVK